MGARDGELAIESALRALLERRRHLATLRNLTVAPLQSVDFSSNDFLSLSKSPSLKAAYLKELDSSKLALGSGGSRLLDGNSQYAEDLEQEIAAFHHAQTGLLFNSGFDANAGFFACVPQPGDTIIYDEYIHASVHDGMKLSRAARRLPFTHNSVAELRKTLQTCLDSDEALRNGKRHLFVAVEAIYSMDGDVAPLKEIVEAVESTMPNGCGYVVVDEAHSTGVLGPQGRGLVCELGLEKRIFARLHTFGKALACNGAIILGSPTLRHYLINYARPLIYTTFMSYPALAAIRAAYSLLRTGHTEMLALRLKEIIWALFNELHRQSSIFEGILTIPDTCPQSPIFSIQSHQPKPLAAFLQAQGFVVRAVVPPTVPEGTSRIRVCLHAGNTLQEIEQLVGNLKAWALERGEVRTSVTEESSLSTSGETVVVKARL